MPCWTIERIREDARRIGPATAALCEQILEARPHPEQGYRACLGIVRLVGSYGATRVEAAAERAIEIGARTYGSVNIRAGSKKSSQNNTTSQVPAAWDPNLKTFTVFAWTSTSRNIMIPYDLVFPLHASSEAQRESGGSCATDCGKASR